MHFYTDEIIFSANNPHKFFKFFCATIFSFFLVGSLTLLVNPPWANDACSHAQQMISEYPEIKKQISQMNDDQQKSAFSHELDNAFSEVTGKCLKKRYSSLDIDDWIEAHWFVFAICLFLAVKLTIWLFINMIDRWLKVEDDKIFATCNNSNASKPLSSVFFIRSRKIEKLSYLTLLTTVFFIVGGSTVFFKAASFAEDDISTLLGSESIRQIVQLLGSHAPTKGGSSLIEALPLAFVLLIRIGDVAFTSFVTYMCLRIYRYQLRMSAFYLSRADAFIISKDQSKFLEYSYSFLPVLLDANFDFGKNESTLAQHFAELIRAIRYAPSKEDKDEKSEGQSRLNQPETAPPA